MPSLTIRDIPVKVLKRLRKAAEEENRSLNAQVIQWLDQSAGQWKSREDREELFRRIDSLRMKIYRRHGLSSDSTEILRRMRDPRTRNAK